MHVCVHKLNQTSYLIHSVLQNCCCRRQKIIRDRQQPKMKEECATCLVPTSNDRPTSPRNRLTSRRRRSVIMLVAGIVLGHVTYYIMKSFLLREQYIPCEYISASQGITKRGHSNTDAGDNSATPVAGELLFVGVMTSRRYLRTRAKATVSYTHLTLPTNHRV